VWEAAVVEAQSRSLKPRDNRDMLSELVKLWERLG
jgi:hypothetical protein